MVHERLQLGQYCSESATTIGRLQSNDSLHPINVIDIDVVGNMHNKLLKLKVQVSGSYSLAEELHLLKHHVYTVVFPQVKISKK
ncbi:hypothetical protein M5K25_014319 [Dendrobium thyrsiflorum]|uniref:Uncharacterized protein n=1 Tax=Dendrobium thyrsiflorum TaxID=117978 RepID=A0ABD0V2K8_DENTH